MTASTSAVSNSDNKSQANRYLEQNKKAQTDVLRAVKRSEAKRQFDMLPVEQDLQTLGMLGNMAKSLLFKPFAGKQQRRAGPLYMKADENDSEPAFSIQGSTEPLEVKEHAFFESSTPEKRTSDVSMMAAEEDTVSYSQIAQLMHLKGRHFRPELQVKPEPIEVTITGAAGAIGSNVVHFIAQGRMFGPYKKVNLRLIELPDAMKNLQALSMDVEDCAYSCLGDVSLYDTTEEAQGFKDTQLAILIGARRREAGMDRADLLKANADLFRAQAKALNENAAEDARVLVVGNPCNTNALIVAKEAPNLKRKNITALTRLDQNRAVNWLSKKSGADPESIRNVFVWGNHSDNMAPDISRMRAPSEVDDFICTFDFNRDQFDKEISLRGGEIIKQTGRSSTASVAVAICDHCHDWYKGTQDDEAVSMAVIPERSVFGIDPNLCFSYPCRVDPVTGDWTIADELKPDMDSQLRMMNSMGELQDARSTIFGLKKYDDFKLENP